MQTTRALVITAAVALAAAAVSAQQRKPATGPVYVTTFIDLIPSNLAAGIKSIQQYVADTKKDAGLVRAEAIAQDGRENHLVIYEVWQSQAAFDAHEGEPHTKAFKTTLYPLMGAPFDQRTHHSVP